MKNRSNLVKKVITDKTGKRTTVWVKPSEADKIDSKKVTDSGEKPKGDGSDELNGKSKKELQTFLEVGNKKLDEAKKNGNDKEVEKIEERLEKVRSKLGIKKKEPKETESDQQLPKELYNKIKRREEGKGFEVKLSEKEVYTMLEKGRVGILSAGVNPNDLKEKGKSQKELKKRHKSLEKDLIQKGYTYMNVHGKYEDEEDSIMVFMNDASKDDVVELGKKYNQDSVIYSVGNKNELIYTTGKNAGKANSGEGFDKPTQAAKDFYTEFKTEKGKSKRFALKLDLDKIVDSILKGLKHITKI